MSVQKVSFSGIYDINFPQSYKSDEVDRAYRRVNDFVQEIPFLSKTVDILQEICYTTKAMYLYRLAVRTSCPLRKTLIMFFRGEMSERISSRER